MTTGLKGAAVKSTLMAIEALYGKEGLASVKAAMPENEARAVEGLLSVQLYPVTLSAAIHEALRNVVGKGSWEPSYAVGLAASKIDFTGVYRVLLRAVSYDTVWDRMEVAWNQYNSEGKIEWRERSAGLTRGFVSGVDGYSVGMWWSSAGRAAGLLLLAGAKSATGRVVTGDSTSAEIEMLWIP